jgi:hypothetical protein
MFLIATAECVEKRLAGKQQIHRKPGGTPVAGKMPALPAKACAPESGSLLQNL